jgi:uncharacterized protein (DUF362 family)
MPVSPVVHLIDQTTYHVPQIKRKVQRAMERDGLDVRGRRVFVKPSFVYPARPPRNRAVNTQPEVVAGVIRALKSMGAARILVGEDCLVGPSQNAFLAMGVLPQMRGLAEPCYLQDEPRVEVRVPDALVEERFLMPRSLMEADLFVSLPKLKVNMYATVTLSVKNHVGLLLARDRLSHHHYEIHKKIADLYRTRVPDYVITDAILAGEGQGPMHADAARLSLLVAGANGVAVDAVACALTGFDPAEVEHLSLLHRLGLGPLDLDLITIIGRELLETRRRRLARPRTDFSDLEPSIVVCAGSELACPEGCLGMIRGSLDRWAVSRDWRGLRGLAFITGKPVSGIPRGLSRRRTLVVGDCAADHRHRGVFIPGCPPHPMAITYALLKKGIWGPLETGLGDLAKGTLLRLLRLPVR